MPRPAKLWRRAGRSGWWCTLGSRKINLGEDREQAQREFEVRNAEMMSTLYQEIQETVAALAKAKGLSHVVKVSPGPRPDSDPSDLSGVLNRSVVYADPRNDLTEEVILDLNQKFGAAQTKIPR